MNDLEKLSEELEKAMTAVHSRIGWRSLSRSDRRELTITLGNMFDARLRLTAATVNQVTGHSASIVTNLRKVTKNARSRADKINSTRRAIEFAGAAVATINDLIPFT